MQWLRFSPDWRLIVRTHIVAAMLLVVMGALVFVVAGLAGHASLSPPNHPPLDNISSVSISNDYAGIRLAGPALDCDSSAPDVVQCEGVINGKVLVTEVWLVGQQAVCTATYNGQALPHCLSSFGTTRPFNYFVVIRDDLGLSRETFAAIAAGTQNAGWNESDWIAMALVVSVLLGAGVSVVAWLNSASHPKQIFARLVYSTPLGVMVIAASFVLAQLLLLAFYFID